MMSVAAALVALVHLAFVLFVALGGALALRWPRVMWLHLPAAVWGVWIEWSGRICPLTPLENTLRAEAGLPPHEGDFIARWIFPMLYPQGLTREIQIALGLGVIVLNAIIYAVVMTRTRRRREVAS
jgi:Protein of Unknown function (DUF2784)